MNEEVGNPPLNNQSVLSLVFGILTLLTFCSGWVLFPLTSIFCFPISCLFGFLALVSGAVSLRQISSRYESGSPMAWIGMVLGGIVFLCLMCMVVAIASLFIFAPDAMPTPPFIENFSV